MYVYLGKKNKNKLRNQFWFHKHSFSSANSLLKEMLTNR